ncbi:hypothetical protein C8Q73DRAFT_477774 [Cubamyces lactineus]|nr:hypothetical protein C8Q73DRAFT_477774 [Cubamyces lactineus]
MGWSAEARRALPSTTTEVIHRALARPSVLPAGLNTQTPHASTSRCPRFNGNLFGYDTITYARSPIFRSASSPNPRFNGILLGMNYAHTPIPRTPPRRAAAMHASQCGEAIACVSRSAHDNPSNRHPEGVGSSLGT